MLSDRGMLRPNLQHCPSIRDENKLHESAVWSATSVGRTATRGRNPASDLQGIADDYCEGSKILFERGPFESTTVRAQELEKSWRIRPRQRQNCSDVPIPMKSW